MAHRTGTREEWLAERRELFAAEKELTRRSDELAQRRRELPWVAIDKDYTYSAYARGTDVLWGVYQWLDRAPLGRNESDRWYRLRDEY